MRRTRHLTLSVGGDGAPAVLAQSFLTGEPVELEIAELDQLLDVSASEWSWRTDRSAVLLATQGLLVSDEPGEPFEQLRARDGELTGLGWSPPAAAFHLATRWQGVRGPAPGRDGTRPSLEPRPGSPLPPFHELGGPRLALPPAERDSELYRLLAARRTVRTFDPARPVGLEELSTILRYVWGVHGTAPLRLGDVALRKTSPSGGGLHPIEVYPVVRRVEGVPAGLYHYLTRSHELERVAELDETTVAALVEEATAGQWYFADADVVFVMTARFGRSFWKYRRHAKAFRTLLLDAGHLSQTFYLVCTELGLGPFVTAALDDDALERVLGLDPLREGVLALCGCGRPPAQRGPLEASFTPLDT